MVELVEDDFQIVALVRLVETVQNVVGAVEGTWDGQGEPGNRRWAEGSPVEGEEDAQSRRRSAQELGPGVELGAKGFHGKLAGSLAFLFTAVDVSEVHQPRSWKWRGRTGSRMGSRS